MDNKKIVLWIARIWGTLVLAFVLVFVVMGAFGEESSGELLDARELVTFMFFPVCTIVGLGLAYKWIGLGGLVATIGTCGLFALRPDLISSLTFAGAIAPPGILYLVYWGMTRSDAGRA